MIKYALVFTGKTAKRQLPLFQEMLYSDHNLRTQLPLPADDEKCVKCLLSLLQEEETWYFKPDGSKDTSVALDAYSGNGFSLYYSSKAGKALSLDISTGRASFYHTVVYYNGDIAPNRVVLTFPPADFEVL